MLANVIKELAEGRATTIPITVEQYHRMIELGILVEGEQAELLDGFLVRKVRSHAGEDPTTVGHHHQWVIDQLTDLLLPLADKKGYRLRTQAPLSLPPDGEPEPDAAIVTRPPHGYRERHPGPSDVVIVIEVADSSLQRDRVTKMRIYADHGVGQYIIINLPERVVEEYTQPIAGQGRYAQCSLKHRGEVVDFILPQNIRLHVPADALLPLT